MEVKKRESVLEPIATDGLRDAPLERKTGRRGYIRRVFYLYKSSITPMSLTLNLRSAFLGKASVRAASPMTSKPAGSNNATRSVTAMAKKKGIRVIVTLECTEARSEGGTPSRVRDKRWSFGPREIRSAPPLHWTGGGLIVWSII